MAWKYNLIYYYIFITNFGLRKTNQSVAESTVVPYDDQNNKKKLKVVDLISADNLHNEDHSLWSSLIEYNFGWIQIDELYYAHIRHIYNFSRFLIYYDEPEYLQNLVSVSSGWINTANFIYVIGWSITICVVFTSIYLYINNLRISLDNKINYECGFSPFIWENNSFDVQFFRTGLIFLLFDVEILVLFPWALNYYEISKIGHLSIFFFLFYSQLVYFMKLKQKHYIFIQTLDIYLKKPIY